jgi:hypothetical protein
VSVLPPGASQEWEVTCRWARAGIPLRPETGVWGVVTVDGQPEGEGEVIEGEYSEG